MKLNKAITLIKKELSRARGKFPNFNGPHEGYAVIKEEFDEMWDDIKKDRLTSAEKECVQVAAMAIRYLVDLGEATKKTKK